jgi:hypothetical protein
MSFTAGLTAAKAGHDLISRALELVKREDVDRNEVMARLTELQGLVLETRRALGDGEDENRNLRRKVEDAERRQADDNDLEFVQDGGFWIRKSQKAQEVFCPLCPVCWGEKHQLVPLTPMAQGDCRCAIHAAMYSTRAYHDAQRQEEARRRADDSAFVVIPGPNSWMR